jgi:hypothetical protein
MESSRLGGCELMTALFGVAGSVQLYCDSVGALAQMHNPAGHQRAKHIGVQHQFIRERVARGEIKVSYTATDSMIADVLIEAVAKQQHEKFSKSMGLVKVQF